MHFSDLLDYDADAGYLVEEGSDDDWNPCSSDEDEQLFSSYIAKLDKTKDKDDFLSEMSKELDETIAKVEAHNRGESTTDKPKQEEGESSTNKTTEPQFYDDIYFDSDDSDSGNETTAEKPTEKKKKKRPIPTDEDLFYDPDMDDADQKWVDDYRRSCQPQTTASTSKSQKLPNSDAVLNCPACMSQLCLDCQRHDVYTNQYRAMFVQNCSINMSETLKYPLKSKKRNKKAQPPPGETYHPVKCDVCNTEVAMYDKNEVYHFFNVITSYA
uniref:E2F-associated phosphoprotein n=1 Tax=Strigamia maritima TaxID=126957 RepID=T1IQM1_STRMM